MILWVMLAMIAVAAAAVTLPLLRTRGGRSDPTAEVARRQYVDGATDPDAARRLLAEASPATPRAAKPLGRGGRYALVAAFLIVLIVGTASLYLAVGAPELAGRAPSPPSAPGAVKPDVTAALEQRVLSAPADPAGWDRLGLAYANVHRFTDAAMVYARAARLDPRTAAYASAEGEALTESAGGQVTPGARSAFRNALTADPSDPRARYYLALAKDQAGDHRGAVDDWNTLIASAPPDAPWLPQVRAYVARATTVGRTGTR